MTTNDLRIPIMLTFEADPKARAHVRVMLTPGMQEHVKRGKASQANLVPDRWFPGGTKTELLCGGFKTVYDSPTVITADVLESMCRRCRAKLVSMKWSALQPLEGDKRSNATLPPAHTARVRAARTPKG